MATVGCRAFTTELCSVAWPGKFKPDLPPRYDGTADPAEFLQLYELGIEAANGDEKVMANWFPMVLKDEDRTWLLARSPPGMRCALASSPTSRALATVHQPWVTCAASSSSPDRPCKNTFSASTMLASRSPG